MALSLIITGFLSAANLRVEMGRPTADTTDPGYISTAELEAIIQRHHDNAVEMAKKMASDQIAQGILPASKRLFVPINIVLSQSTNQPSLLEGTIGSTYYPFVIQPMDEEGREYILDEQIGKTVATTFSQRYVYKVIGRTIYVSPGTNDNLDPLSINVHLALETNVWNFLISSEILVKLNHDLVNDARQTLASLIQEGDRLEQLPTNRDGVPGDLT